MSTTVLYMSMSLDGFIAGPNERIDNGLGDGGERLHEWPLGPEPEVNRVIYEEFMETGAIVAGKGTFEPAGGWGGDHHGGAPIFIYSRREPGHRRLRVAARDLRRRTSGPRSSGRGRPRARSP